MMSWQEHKHLFKYSTFKNMPLQKLKKYLENVIFYERKRFFAAKLLEINIHRDPYIIFIHQKKSKSLKKCLIMIIKVTKCVQNNIYVKVSMYSTIL